MNYKRVDEKKEIGPSYVGPVGKGLLGLAFYSLLPLIRSLAFFSEFMAF